MRKIITIQHCQSEQHVNGMVGGATDWPLTELGLRQAENIGVSLKEKLGPSENLKIYSSDLIRASQTAEVVARHFGLSVDYRKDLREINLGSATGKSKEWLRENSIPRPAGVSRCHHRLLPDAENDAEVYDRISRFVAQLEEEKAETIIVVGHGGSLGMFTACWLGISLETLDHMAFSGLAGGVSTLGEWPDGTRVVHVWNDSSYLISNEV